MIVKKLYVLGLTFLAGCAAVGQNKVPQTQPHLITTDANVLLDNKKKLAQDPILSLGYKNLLKRADKALTEPAHSVMEKRNLPPSGDMHDYMSLAPYFWPDPTKKDGLPYIRKDGQTNPEVKDYLDKEYMPKLCEDAYVLTLAYFFSGKEQYAAKASELIHIWFINPATKMNPNLNFAQAIKGVNEGRGAGLIDTRHFIKLIDALTLLKSYQGWKEEDNQQMRSWFASFLNWMQTSKNGRSELAAANNHGTWYDAQRMSMAMFIDSLDLAKQIAGSAAQRLNNQMDPEGKFPREMERTIALHYNVFNLEAFFLIARMAQHLGIDFWTMTTANGSSLKKGFNYFKPYLMNAKSWDGQQIKDFDPSEGYSILFAGSKNLDCTDCNSFLRTALKDTKEYIQLLY